MTWENYFTEKIEVIKPESVSKLISKKFDLSKFLTVILVNLIKRLK